MFSNNDYSNDHPSWFSSLDSNVLSVLDNTPSIRGGSLLDHINDNNYGAGAFGNGFSTNGNSNNSSGGFFSSWFDSVMGNYPTIGDGTVITSAPSDNASKKCSTTDYLSAIAEGCVNKVADKETVKDVVSSATGAAVMGGLIGGPKGAGMGAAIDAGKNITKACVKGSYETVEKRCGIDSTTSTDSSGSSCIIL